jgi:methylmalonyl-CoA/ethylmalonyl-CoA epimerase
MKIKKPLHVGISVGDIEEAALWYAKNLGFKAVGEAFYAPPLMAKLQFLRQGDFEIELFEYDDPKSLPEERLTPNSDLQTIGTKHAAFEIEDYNATHEEFLENGVDIAHEVEMGKDRVMFVRDNSGVLIELIYRGV